MDGRRILPRRGGRLRREFDIRCATVLNRESRGENSLLLAAFSDSSGLCRMVKRMSAKSTSAAPDIFDDFSAKADSRGCSSPPFLGEFEITAHRGRIASNYDSFVHASEICKCVLKNGAHAEDSAGLSALLRRALDAVERGASAKIVRLKFMYLYALGGGYPVKEDFLASLPPWRAEIFSRAVKTPADGCALTDGETESLLENFLSWIRSGTDIAQ